MNPLPQKEAQNRVPSTLRISFTKEKHSVHLQEIDFALVYWLFETSMSFSSLAYESLPQIRHGIEFPNPKFKIKKKKGNKVMSSSRKLISLFETKRGLYSERTSSPARTIPSNQNNQKVQFFSLFTEGKFKISSTCQ